MADTIHFNTGRLYTRLGQRITATRHDDGIVTFWDHDRHVFGEYLFAPTEWEFDRQSVMDAYDNGEYLETERAWNDAMVIGGCNTRYYGKAL